MTIQEQQKTKAEGYAEAIRYMNNAKKYLQDAQKDGKYYKDAKYVKTACGAAYNGVLIALDCLFLLWGVKPPKKGSRKSIEYYTANLKKRDGKLLDALNSAYETLHLWGYYDGIKKVDIVKSGFDDAYDIIEKINPNPNP